jgi:hypothetical protein
LHVCRLYASIIGKDYQTTEQVRGFLTWKDIAKAGAAGGGYWGSFVGGLFGILAGAGVLFIPGIAPIVVAGPIAGVLAGWLEGTLVGGAGAAAIGGLAGALGGLGIPKHEVLILNPILIPYLYLKENSTNGNWLNF